MNRTEKEQMVATLGEKLQGAKLALVAGQSGLSVVQANELRRQLREVDGECRVTKNTLTKRALEGTPYAEAERWLDKQTTLVFGYDDPVAVAKVVAKWAEDQSEKVWIKGGVFEGELLEADRVVELSKTPSLEVLRAQFLGLLQQPATRLARVLNEPAASLARVLAARRDAMGD